MSTVCETGFINIVDAFLNPDGTAWTGAITYTLQYATTAAGATLIQARQNINVSDGIDICLAPGLYTVVYNQSGHRLPVTSQWTVPPLGGPYTIADIEGATGAITTSLTVSGAFSALGSVTMASLVNASARPYVTTDANGLLGTSNLAAVAISGSASDLSTGTLAAARGGAGTINGILTANGSGLVSAASTTGSGSVVLATTPTFSGVITAPTLTAPASTNLNLNGGSSGANITIEDNNPGRILFTPLQPIDPSYLDMIFANVTVTGTFLGDTFLSRSSLVANNATINNHSAALLGEFRATGTTLATQYVAGVYGIVYQRASGLLSEVNANFGVIKIQGNGDITEASAFKTEMAMESGSGRMVTARNFYGAGLTISSGATIPTTLVLFDAADIGVAGVKATNVFAFRSLGNTPSSFAGPVDVGALSTVGAITSTYTLASSSSTTGAIVTAGGLGVAKDIRGGQGLFLSGGSTAANGVNFGTSNEAMFRTSAGNLRITCGGVLGVDADIIPVTTSQNDLGTSSLKWRGLVLSGTATVRNLIITAPTVPSSASDTGTTGQFAWASGFLYICVATNTWQRVAVATW